MKKIVIFTIIMLVSACSLFSDDTGFEGRPIINNLWMPTGYTLHKGEFVVGLGSIGFGLNENVQLGTNVLLFLFQIYNANLKLNIVKSPTMSISAGIDYRRFNLSSLLDNNELAFNSIAPYVVLSTPVGESTILHLAGKYSYFSTEEDIEDYEPESSSSGTEVMGGLEYSMSHKTKFLAECGYDITFDGWRIGGGVLFGWEKFRLKLGVGYYAPENTDKTFTMPVIGLWWRFNG